MKHTQEPWSLGDFSTHGQYIWDKRGKRIIAETYPDEHQDFEANALRIVKCINACEGINPTIVPEMLPYIRKIWSSIENGTLDADFSDLRERFRNITRKAEL